MAKARFSKSKWILIGLVVMLSVSLTSCDMILGLIGKAPPVADAGGDQTVAVGDLVTLDASGSTGGTLTYSWTLTPPADSTAVLSSKTMKRVTFRPDVPGDYFIDLTVKDENGQASVSIVVTAGMPAGFYTEPIISTPITVAGGTLTMTWAQAHDGLDNPADSYKVYRSNSLTGTYLEVTSKDADPTDTSYSQTIAATSTYYFKVKAVYGANLSAFSAAVSVTGTAFTLSAPTGFMAGTTTWNSIPLTWTAVTGATGYDIERSATSGGTFTTIATGLADTTYTDNAGLSPSTSYFYKIRSVATGTTSSWSAEISGTTAAQPTAVSVPAQPTAVSVFSATSNSLLVSWTLSDTSILYFEVQMSSDAGATWTTIASQTDAITANSFVAKNLLSSMNYAFKVRGVNSKGAGAWSANATGMTLAATTSTNPPASAPSLQPGLITQTSIEVKWLTVADAKTYQLQYKGGALTTFTDVPGASDTTSTSAILTGLSASTSYSFQIRAKNTAGYGPWSATATWTTSAATTQPAPTGPLNIYFDNQTSSSFHVYWNQVSYADYYVVTVSKSDPMVSSFDFSQTTSMFDATLSGLLADTNYYVKVTARNSSGSYFNTSQTRTNPVATQNLPPTSPNGLTVSNAGGTTAYLSWSSSFGWNGTFGNYYAIYRLGPYDSQWQWAGQVDQNSTYFYDTSYLTPGWNYQYKVIAVNVFSGSNLSSGDSNIAWYTVPNGIAPVLHTYVDPLGNIELYWDYNSQQYSFDIYLSSDNGMNWSYVGYYYAYNGSYVWFYKNGTPSLPALSAGQSYTFRVIAYDQYYNSASTEISYTPPSSSASVTISVH